MGREKKGGAAVSRHKSNLAEALMKEMVASNIILLSTVLQFRSPNKSKGKSFSDKFAVFICETTVLEIKLQLH